PERRLDEGMVPAPARLDSVEGAPAGFKVCPFQGASGTSSRRAKAASSLRNRDRKTMNKASTQTPPQSTGAFRPLRACEPSRSAETTPEVHQVRFLEPYTAVAAGVRTKRSQIGVQ